MLSRFDAALFDCDGVLVDSEPITNRVLREMLGELGWSMSVAECMRIFVGKAVKDEIHLIEKHTGKTIDDGWVTQFRTRRNAALERELTAIDGAVEAVLAIHEVLEGRIACASGADRFKVELQLETCGLIKYFGSRIFSGHEMPRSKPAPDVYLAAAHALKVNPARCVVIEDTVTGVTAGVSAGATVFGYCPPHAGPQAADALKQAGAEAIFTAMADLPALI